MGPDWLPARKPERYGPAFGKWRLLRDEVSRNGQDQVNGTDGSLPPKIDTEAGVYAGISVCFGGMAAAPNLRA